MNVLLRPTPSHPAIFICGTISSKNILELDVPSCSFCKYRNCCLITCRLGMGYSIIPKKYPL